MNQPAHPAGAADHVSPADPAQAEGDGQQLGAAAQLPGLVRPSLALLKAGAGAHVGHRLQQLVPGMNVPGAVQHVEKILPLFFAVVGAQAAAKKHGGPLVVGLQSGGGAGGEFAVKQRPVGAGAENPSLHVVPGLQVLVAPAQGAQDAHDQEAGHGQKERQAGQADANRYRQGHAQQAGIQVCHSNPSVYMDKTSPPVSPEGFSTYCWASTWPKERPL